MLTLIKKSIVVLAVPVLLTSIALADDAPAAGEPVPQLASATAPIPTDTSATPPHRYCKDLPNQNEEAPICQEECCQTAEANQPMTDCSVIAYPCGTQPPL